MDDLRLNTWIYAQLTIEYVSFPDLNKLPDFNVAKSLLAILRIEWTQKEVVLFCKFYVACTRSFVRINCKLICLYYILGILTRGQPSVLTLKSREFGMYYWFRSYIITSPDIYAFILLYMYMLLSWKMCFYLVIYAFILLCMLLS